ncbi:hypothetical protein MGWOODY_Smn1898 [hydrothermal vent metagenome]|uniref:Uncharacterized protein n=1 Tax=hydrothermal vent metagenome TaxID=652676 RepID=A0A160TLL4_9ZZZZ
MGIADRKFLEQHGEGELRLDHGELAADAGALAIAERLVGMGMPGGLSLGQPAVDVELFRIGPDAGIAVQAGREDVDRPILAHVPFAADHHVLERRDAEGGRRRPEAHRLLQDALDHLQLHDVGIVRTLVAGQDPIDLGIGLRQDVRMAQQQMLGKGEQPRCRLMPGDQEGEHLIADVDVVEALARFRIDRTQHEVEQVLPVVGMKAAFGDDAIDQRVHLGDVGLVLAHRLFGEALLDRQPSDHIERFTQRPTERLQEAVQFLLLEAVEAVAEACDRNRIEREAGHVVSDEHVSPRQARPFADKLVGHLEHHVEIAAHRTLAEGGKQDAMRLAPVRFLAERGEQSVAGELAHHPQARPGHLAEASLVAQFGDEIGRSDEQADPAAEFELEDALGEITADGEQVTDQPGAGDLVEMPDDGQARWRRNHGSLDHSCRHPPTFPLCSRAHVVGRQWNTGERRAQPWTIRVAPP